MNSNGREVEFRELGYGQVAMMVERDCAPFDDYVCGMLRKDEEGFFRFHPSDGVVMHQKLLREAAAEVARLNGPNVGIEPPKVGSNDGLGPVLPERDEP